MQKPCYIMPDGRVRSTGRLKLAAAKTQRVGGTADGAEPPGGAAFLFCCPALRNSSWSTVRADGSRDSGQSCVLQCGLLDLGTL